MNKFILILFLIVPSVTAESFKELQEIPKDSTNAETMKIWIPVEGEICEVKVKILDKNSNVVRELLERRVSKGYYNIYWDKKDDSGYYAEEGVYNVAIISCNYRKMSKIKVEYQNGENTVLLGLTDDTNPPALALNLLQDSVRVTVAILNKRNLLLKEIVVDSLFQNPSSEIAWKPRLNVLSGIYQYRVTVKDFNHYIKFRYKRKVVNK